MGNTVPIPQGANLGSPLQSTATDPSEPQAISGAVALPKGATLGSSSTNTQPDEPGFTQELSKYTGFQHPVESIKQTGTMLTSWGGIKQIGSAMDFAAQGAKDWFEGMGQKEYDAISKANGGGVKGNLMALSESIKRDAAPVGSLAANEAVSQALQGHWRSAAGAATAAAITVGLLFLGPEADAGETGDLLRTLGPEKGEAELANGAKQTVTAGMLRGGVVAKLQKYGQSLGFGAKRSSIESIEVKALGNVSRVLEDSAKERGVSLDSQIQTLNDDPSAVAYLVGDSLRQAASEQHYSVLDRAMREGDIKPAQLDVVSETANGFLKKFGEHGFLTRQTPVSQVVRSAVEDLAREGHVERSWSEIEGTLSSLKSAMRDKEFNPYEKSLIGSLVDSLDLESQEVIKQSLGQEGVDHLLTGRRLTKEGYAFRDVGAEFRGIKTGGRDVLPGATRFATELNAQTLRSALDKLSEATPSLKGSFQRKSTLETAITDPVKRQTLNQIADLMSRGNSAAGGFSGATLGLMGAMGTIGKIASVAGQIGLHSLFGITTNASGWVSSMLTGLVLTSYALKSETGAQMLLAYLKYGPKTLAGAQAAYQISLLPAEKIASASKNKAGR